MDSGGADEPWGSLDDDASLLVARFRRDDDGTGKLEVTARAGGFGGRGSAWLHTSAVLEFARSLALMPVPGTPPVLAGGYTPVDGPAIDTIRLEVRQVTSVGQIAVCVHAESNTNGLSSQVPTGSADLDLLTTYQQLWRFDQELELVARGEAVEAHLRGELLA